MISISPATPTTDFRGCWVFTSDWHIRRQDRIWSGRPEIFGDVSYGLDQVAEIVEKYSAEILLAAGDLFHEKLHTGESIYVAAKFLDRMQSLGCRVIFVQGQHELSPYPILSSIRARVIWAHEQLIDIDGCRVYGLDYCTPTRVREALQSVPACDFLLTHQVWKLFMGDFGYAEIADVPSHVGNIITGDFHVPVVKTVGDRTVFSPGPLCRQKIDETADKSVVLFNPIVGEYRLEPLRERQVYFYQIRPSTEIQPAEQVDCAIADLQAWLDEYEATQAPSLPDDIRQPILYIQLHPDFADYHDHVTTALSSRSCHLFLRPLNVSVADQSILVPPDHTDEASKERIDVEQLVRANYSAEEAADILRLLRCSDVQSTIEEVFDRRVDDILKKQLEEIGSEA